MEWVKSITDKRMGAGKEEENKRRCDKVNKSEEIRNILKIERRKRNMNYKEFGALLGCTGRSVSYWETGKRNISLDAADKAFKNLGITVTIGKKN